MVLLISHRVMNKITITKIGTAEPCQASKVPYKTSYHALESARVWGSGPSVSLDSANRVVGLSNGLVGNRNSGADWSIPPGLASSTLLCRPGGAI